MQFRFMAIGTHWVVDVYDAPKNCSEKEVFRIITERIDRYDRSYSRFRSDSVVHKMAKSEGTYTLPRDSQKLFAVYDSLYKQTQGKVSPLVGQIMADAGYDHTYSLKPQTLTQPPPWEAVLTYSKNKVTVEHPTILDFGAAGKGQLIDLVGAELKKMKITNFCIDAGSDILHHYSTGKPLRIGLEDPRHTNRVIGIASLANASLCASAANRRAWKDYHHIIDPHLLASPRHILASWVVSDETIWADALATSLFLADARELKACHYFEYAVLFADYSLEKSLHFPAEFFIQEYPDAKHS